MCRSRFLRQSLILSRYDTPEARSLFSQHCQNLEGKIRLDRDFTGVLDRVRSGVRQVFERFDEGQRGFEGSAAAEEVEARLSYFTKKVGHRPVLVAEARPFPTCCAPL